MLNFKRLILSAVLALSLVAAASSVLCPSIALATHESGAYADPYSWNGQQAAEEAQARNRERQREQQKQEEQDSYRRSQEQQRSLYDTPAPAPRHRDSGPTYNHSYNSSSGIFTDCSGYGNFQTCTSTGGK